MEITASSVFRKNPFLNWVLKTCSDISTGYLSLLEQFMGAMELKYNRKGSIVQMLETINNTLFGRL